MIIFISGFILILVLIYLYRYTVTYPLAENNETLSIDRVEYFNRDVRDHIETDELKKILSDYKRRRSRKYILKGYFPENTPKGNRVVWDPLKVVKIELTDNHESWTIVFERNGEALCYKEGSDIWEIMEGEQLLEEIKEFFAESGLN